MRGPLPVYVDDPVARLRVVRKAMDGLKESKQAVGAEVLAGVQNFAPPTILAQASRLNFSTRLFNLIVTNVPGPQFPLYVLGRELQDVFPVAFLPQEPRAGRSRSCPTTAGWTSACSATTTRCPTSTRSASGVDARSPSCVADREAAARIGRPARARQPSSHERRRVASAVAGEPLSSRARTSRPRTSGPGSTAA